MIINIKTLTQKIKELLEAKYEQHCLFCRHYHTACGRCKGQELEICGNYIDVGEIGLWERVIKFIGRVK